MKRLALLVCTGVLLCGCEIEIPDPDADGSSVQAPSGGPAPAVDKGPPPKTDFTSVDEGLTTLVQACRDGEKPQQVAAFTWLCKQGPGAIDAVVATMNDTSLPLDARRHACRILGHLGPSATEPLIAASHSDEAALQFRAIETMPVVKPPQIVIINRLIELLDHSNNQVQNTAIRSLGQIGPAAKPSADKLSALRQSHTNETTRQEAGKSLKLVRPIRTFED